MYLDTIHSIQKYCIREEIRFPQFWLPFSFIFIDNFNKIFIKKCLPYSIIDSMIHLFSTFNFGWCQDLLIYLIWRSLCFIWIVICVSVRFGITLMIMVVGDLQCKCIKQKESCLCFLLWLVAFIHNNAELWWLVYSDVNNLYNSLS